MERTRTTIYLGRETRRLAAGVSAGSSLSSEIEWAVDAYVSLVEDALPAFRLAEWAAIVLALEHLEPTRPSQARFVGDELVRAHKRGDVREPGVDLGSIGYRLGAASFPAQLAVLHVARATRAGQADQGLHDRLQAVLPAKAIKA